MHNLEFFSSPTFQSFITIGVPNYVSITTTEIVLVFSDIFPKIKLVASDMPQ